MRPTQLMALTISVSAVFVAVACGSSTEVSSVWVNEEFAERPIGSTLVVGVAEQEATRVLFEERFVAALDNMGVTAQTSVSLLGSDTELTREAVEAALAGGTIDSVLVTRLIGRETERIYTPPAYAGQQGASATMYDATARSYYAAGIDGTYVEQEVVIIETALYDVATENLIWTAETDTVDPGDVEEEIDGLVSALVKALSDTDMM